jgi:hypothetical protein
MLRKFFGAGPASGQVQYVTKKQGAVPVSTDGSSEEGQGADGDEDEDDGLSAKFRRSALPTRFDRRLVTFLRFCSSSWFVYCFPTQVRYKLVYMRYDCFMFHAWCARSSDATSIECCSAHRQVQL